MSTEKVGRRLYATGNTYAVKDQLKSLGCHWDPDRRQWWISPAKAKELEAILDAPAQPPKPEDSASWRLVGKARYRGKVYYCRWVGRKKDGDYAAHLCTLDGKVDFWAVCAEPHERTHDGNGDVAVIVKMYSPREYRGQITYTTLGSIRSFIEREQENRKSGGAVCAECGTSGDLVIDTEDGLPKHRRCCDMPPS